MTPVVNGCICQVCAERGIECVRVAKPGEDECVPCATGNHHQYDVVDRLSDGTPVLDGGSFLRSHTTPVPAADIPPGGGRPDPDREAREAHVREEHDATHGEAEQCGAECIALGLADFDDEPDEDRGEVSVIADLLRDANREAGR